MFKKLEPNTERCIRLNVARVLVEVDLSKPLPNKISFLGRTGEDVVFTISYPWLPPHSLYCSKWGHVGKDCPTPKPTLEVVELSIVVVLEAVNDSVEMEGFSSKDALGKTPSKIVTKLMEELESISRKASLSGECVPKVADEQTVLKLSPENTLWSLVSEQKNNSVSPIKVHRSSNGCVSPMVSRFFKTFEKKEK